MFYEALYRKWRPKIFEDIIGQEQTVTILKNQIKYSNIAHAYLFTGMRGTGKTSTARIFARTVNCLNPQGANPCNACEICEGILKESNMDVIEIDAASNTGVDNIRELRENTKYNPSRGKYKIYIIDEVHMLSRGAFNALLKTLEEPPAHVIFILSTTEPHKVPATILSRCQRFDFKPVKTKDIINQLSLICKEMSINYEEESLHLIALNSGGAVRDALSILDRCISFDNETLKYDDVINILGAVNYDSIFNLVESIAEQSTPDVLTLINEIFTEGKDAGQLMKDLIFHFRNLLLIKMDVKIDDFLVLPKERLEQFKEQSKLFNVNQVSSFIYTLSDIDSKLKYSSQPKILMEVAVASLCSRELDDSLEGIIERVKRLEKIIATGKADIEQKVELGDKEELKGDERIKNSKGSKNGEKLEDDKKTESKDGEKSEDSKGPKDDKARGDGEKPKDNRGSEDNVRALNTIKGVWEQILDQTKRDGKTYVGTYLEEGTLKELKKGTLTISLELETYFDRLNKKGIKEYISGVITKFTGQDVRISFVMEDGPTVVMEDEPIMSGDSNGQKDLTQNPGEGLSETSGQVDPLQILEEISPEVYDMTEIIDA